MTGPIWHWTCDHRAPMIREDGLVKPHPQPVLARLELSWWSDLGPEHRYELGLTSNTLSCDRMEARFEAKIPAELIWWPHYARFVPRAIRDQLEVGRLPAHWWIAIDPIAVTW
jgi:hypothetical protein